MAALLGDLSTWRGLIDTVLPLYVRNTLMLTALVAAGTAAIGTGAAWLVTMYRFPGARLFEVVLVLPLAFFQAYVLAYAYTDLPAHSGGGRDGAPHRHRLGAARLLVPEHPLAAGCGADADLRLLPVPSTCWRDHRHAAVGQRLPRRAHPRPRAVGGFFAVSLPMARPGIAAGVLLAVMETIADYGTVAHFNVRTFSTGIYQAWFAMQDRAAAAQQALCLLGFALLLAAFERIERGQAQSYLRGESLSAGARRTLSGWRGLAAAALCGVPVAIGFLLPVVVLAAMARGSGQSLADPLPAVRRQLADPRRDRGGRHRRRRRRDPVRPDAPGAGLAGAGARGGARLRGAGRAG